MEYFDKFIIFYDNKFISEIDFGFLDVEWFIPNLTLREILEV